MLVESKCLRRVKEEIHEGCAQKFSYFFIGNEWDLLKNFKNLSYVFFIV